MRKNFIDLFLICSILSVIILFASGCDDISGIFGNLFNKHEHNYETTIVAPTCTQSGYTLITCTGCNDSRREDVTSALGHNFSEAFITDVDPTCTSVGIKSRHCSRCSERTGQIEIEALGHNYSMEYTIDSLPTCTEKGYKSRHCTRCSSYIDRTVSEEALGHSYTERTISPTCNTRGYTSHTCSRCNSSYSSDYVNSLGHNITSTTVTEPTCLSIGYTKYNCSRCSGYYDDEVPALGHRYTNGFCVRCNDQDPNYYIFTALKDSPAYWNATDFFGGKASHQEMITLSDSAKTFISSKYGENIIINVEFELKAEKAWPVSDYKTYISGSTGSSAIKYYCTGTGKFSTNGYQKYSFSLEVPASEFKNGAVYFTGRRYDGALIENMRIYVRNLKIGIGSAS